MPEEDKIAGLAKKLDKKALAGAVGLMLMSWAALPIVYWLILRLKKKGGVKENDNRR
jgi:hypothetical protein